MERIEKLQQRTSTDSMSMEENAHSLSVSVPDAWLNLVSRLSAIVKLEFDGSGKLHDVFLAEPVDRPRSPDHAARRHVVGGLGAAPTCQRQRSASGSGFPLRGAVRGSRHQMMISEFY